MTKSQRYGIYGIIASLGILSSLLAYAKAWEALQPEEYLSNRKIISIEQYWSSNDLHWSLKGYRIHIVGEHKPIDFPLKNWDRAVQVGDSVNLIVKRSFPWLRSKGELDGLRITLYKTATIEATRQVKTQKDLFDE